MTAKTSQILDHFRHLYKEFMSEGADSNEAQVLAAAVAARQSLSPDLLRTVKNRSEVTQYAFRGLVLTVSGLGIKQSRDGDRHVFLSLKARSGGLNRELRLKGDQAMRLAILLILKFERFEDDLVRGFSIATIHDREEELCSKLVSQGKRIDQPDGVDSELVRNIRRKIESELGIYEMIRAIGADSGYRIEVAPNNIVFEPAALASINNLTSNTVTDWYERFHVSPGEHD